MYDLASRVTQAKHTELGGSEPFLQLDYGYSPTGLIWSINETRNGVLTVMGFNYDHLGRLTEEIRFGTPSYHLQYEYDAGGNRTKKTDVVTSHVTTYWYDTDTINLPGWLTTPAHVANRLLGYEVVDTPTSNVVLRVKYEYAFDGPAAGNVTQVRRMTPQVQPATADDPFPLADVAATCFRYNPAGEVWIVTQRTWIEDNGVLRVGTAPEVKDIEVERVSGGGKGVRKIFWGREVTISADDVSLRHGLREPADVDRTVGPKNQPATRVRSGEYSPVHTGRTGEVRLLSG